MNEREEVRARPVSAPASGVALSLVIPCFNEGQRLEDGVARLRLAIEAGAIVPSTTEFVVVDDGSTDDTSAVATALFAPVSPRALGPAAHQSRQGRHGARRRDRRIGAPHRLR